MSEQHTVSVKVEGEWREVSRHDGRDEAFRAMETALSRQEPGATAKIDPGGELFLLRPDGKVIEVMDD
jgi:hypothetical protein